MELKIVYDATHEVWFAFDGEDENNSTAIGQGQTPENACSDFWYQRRGDAATLAEEFGGWVLRQGCHAVHCVSKAEALKTANKLNWNIL
jgi:hypothetical protein